MAGSEEDIKDVIPRTRETWTRKIDFLLACIGFSVGLGNVWRFPYLCFKNGGGAFLIPYFLCAIFGGIPLFFLEVSLGQFMSEGGTGSWKICPLFQGIGWSTTATVFFLNCYYNVILAWALYYMFSSFAAQLPWTTCDNYWNNKTTCTVDFGAIINATTCNNGTTPNCTVIPPNMTRTDPTVEFWEHKVLGISSGVDDVGTIKWDLALCLLLAWVLVFVCICKGIRSSGKVMYVTATSPYLLMLILLVRGCTLPGAVVGIEYYLKPDFQKMLNTQVWVDAGTQVFFSYSISLGTLTALGSYNKFRHNSYRDAILFSCTNSGTSIFAGFVIFSVLGYMSVLQGVPMKDVAESGPGLAFIAYPKALSQMPIAQFWSFLFFLMVILLGLDSQFVGVEGLITSFQDAFPRLRQGVTRPIFVGVCCLLQFIVGLSMVTNGGMYVFQLFDYYSGSKVILVVAFLQCVVVAHIYGVERFYDNLQMMYGFRINPFMKIMWLFVSPLVCIIVFVLSVITYSELTYERPPPVPKYHYPNWAVAIGWSLAASTFIWIPIMMVYQVLKNWGSDPTPIRNRRWRSVISQKWSNLITPYDLKPHQLRPGIDDVNGTMMTSRASPYSKAAEAGAEGAPDNTGL